MKTYPILYRHMGEVSYTPRRPVAVFEGQVDLTEQKEAILSSDDFRPIKVNRYEVKAIELPDWLDPQEWLRDPLAWEAALSLAEPDWPESWVRLLVDLHPEPKKRSAAAKLLKTKNFRSEFRQSLRNQIVAWIETPPDEREYKSPLSYRQWNAITRYER